MDTPVSRAARLYGLFMLSDVPLGGTRFGPGSGREAIRNGRSETLSSASPDQSSRLRFDSRIERPDVCFAGERPISAAERRLFDRRLADAFATPGSIFCLEDRE